MALRIGVRRGELICIVNNMCESIITSDAKFLFNYIILSLNFNYTFHTAPEFTKRNCTEWDFLFRMLYKNQTNLLFTPTVSDGSFANVIGTTNAFGVTETLIISKSCTVQEVSMEFLLTILSREVWMTICVCLFTVSFLSYLEEIVRRGLRHQRLMEHLWFNICSLLQKPYKDVPNSLTSRILNLNWILALVILFSAYSGNMKTSYIVNKDCNVNTLEDVVRSPKLVPIMSVSSPSYHLTKNSHLAVADPLFNQLNRTNGVLQGEYYQPTDILQKVLYGRGVFIENTQTVAMVLPFLSMMSECNDSFDHLIHVGTARYFTVSAVLLYNKNGTDRRIMGRINERIARFHETGHRKKRTEMEWQNIDKYIDNNLEIPKIGYDVVKLRGIRPVFQILLFGIEVAGAICFISFATKQIKAFCKRITIN